jgi:hypothetical protein
MNLSTMRYFESPLLPVAEKPAGTNDAAWIEVTKGLLSVIAGYVLSVFNVAAGVGLIWITTRGFRKPLVRVEGDDFTLLLVGSAVLFFTSLFSSYLLLRGKWRCVMNAPERYGAKWLMFGSMICVCAGPALNFVAGFTSPPPPATRQMTAEELEKAGGSKAVVRVASQLREANTAAVLRLTGSAIGVLGPILFVLFLRAVHGCLGSFLGARFTELYLLFLVLLFAGSLSLLLDARVRLQADLLVSLAIGWLVAAAWYILLILGAVFGISAHLNAPRSVQEP